MAFCITVGTHEFESQMQGYENVRAYCRNCEHWDAYCVTRWPWFTVCFVPVLPLSFHKYNEVTCARCRFIEDINQRPDIQPGQPHPAGFQPQDQSKQQYSGQPMPMATGGVQNQGQPPQQQQHPQQFQQQHQPGAGLNV